MTKKKPDHVSPASQTDEAWLAQSPFNGAPLTLTTLLLVLSGLIGSLLFTLTYIIEGITRPGYDAWQQPVSALSLGPGGWIQQINFVVFGVIILCTVPASRKIVKGGTGVIWYPILRCLNGVSFIMLGFFSQDPTPGYPPGGVVLGPPTPHGMIHIVFSFVSFIAAASSCFVLARRLAREPRWRGWATFSVITGLLIIAFVILYGALNAQHSPIAGLFERLSGGVDTLWGLLLITRLFSIQREALAESVPQRALS